MYTLVMCATPLLLGRRCDGEHHKEQSFAPSRTSQNLSLLFFKIPLIIPKLFYSDSKKIIAIAN